MRIRKDFKQNLEEDFRSNEDDWTIKNMVVCDLTYVSTEEGAREIKSIKNCGIIYMPANAPDEVKSILSKIKLKNIGMVMWVDSNERKAIKIVSGDEILRQKNLGQCEHILVLGNITIPSDNLTYNHETPPVKLNITGTALISKDIMDSGQIEIEQLIGDVSKNIKFDDIKEAHTNEIDKYFIEELVPNTIISFSYAYSGKKRVKIDKNVSVELLKQKNIYFDINTNLVNEKFWKCSDEVKSYIRTHIV